MKPGIQGYPRDSRAYVRIDTSIRLYWHGLFDVCPRLLTLVGSEENSGAIFRPFMAWAAERRLSMDWTYYLWVYRWLALSEFRERVDRDIRVELLGASASRWAIRDRTGSAGIVLGSVDVPFLVVAWKCHEVDGSREVETVEPEEDLPAPDGLGFFTVPDYSLEFFPGWSPIPR
jgi:uncharacterized repeat protein (TIGR04061 family)